MRLLPPAVFLPIALLALVPLRTGNRIRRAGRYPLPGARVAADTPIVEGAAARRLALRFAVVGVLVVAISLAGAAYGYYVLGRLLEKPSKDNNMATRETKPAAAGPDIDALWEYSQPEASEARFRQSLGTLQGDARLETLTQIARTLSLRGRFPEAHRLLDEIEPQLAAAGPRPRIRYLLERGRTFNSAGEKERARGLFLEAWKDARGTEVGLAADAAHMVAITYSGTAHAVEWNHRGLALARSSTDPRARALVPAMLNNQAWDLHAMGRYPEALRLFEEALQEWTARAMPERIRIARWSVARCLRSLGRHEEALALQRSLEAEHAAAGTSDPQVTEEIEALLRALGRG